MIATTHALSFLTLYILISRICLNPFSERNMQYMEYQIKEEAMVSLWRNMHKSQNNATTQLCIATCMLCSGVMYVATEIGPSLS